MTHPHEQETVNGNYLSVVVIHGNDVGSFNSCHCWSSVCQEYLG